jgi:hypothetical protein
MKLKDDACLDGGHIKPLFTESTTKTATHNFTAPKHLFTLFFSLVYHHKTLIHTHCHQATSNSNTCALFTSNTCQFTPKAY